MTQFYRRSAALGDHTFATQALLEAILTAPEFIYHFEGLDRRDGEVVPLDPFEIASRLSFLLWRSVPDDRLLDAAASGELQSQESIVSHVRRMIADERFDRAIFDFHQQWSGYGRLATLTRNSTLFPEFTRELRDSMLRSLEAYLRDAVRGGRFVDFLTSNTVYVDRHLAPIVGLSSTSSELIRASVDRSQRAGILGQPGLMAALAYANQTDPIHRGIFVAQRLICRDLEAPSFAFTLPEPRADVMGSFRQQFEMLHSNPGCASCHRIIDPLGFGLDSLDPIGRFRTHDRGHRLDVSGTLPAEVGLDDAAFAGVSELSLKLSRSQVVTECYARQWARFALRRQETMRDACTVARAYEALRDGTIVDMLVALVTSPSFTNRTIPNS